MTRHLLISPLRVAKTKTKDFILNLNNYRNTHYQTLNKTKVNYKELMYPQISKLPKLEDKILVTYRLYPASQRRTDISNVCSIHDKYFCDALSELGKIEDDDYTHLPMVIYEFGEVDKDNPRVEIRIYEGSQWTLAFLYLKKILKNLLSLT